METGKWKFLKVGAKAVYGGLMTFLTVIIGINLAAPFAARQMREGMMVITAFLSTVVFLILYYGKIREKLIFAGSLLALVIALMLLKGAGESGAFWQGYVNWLLDRGSWVSEQVIYYEFFNLFVIGLLIGLFARAAERLPILQALAAVLAACYLVFCMIKGNEISKVTVCFLLFYIVIIVVERMQSAGADNAGYLGQRAVIWVLPFLALQLLLVALLPAKQEPLNWEGLKRLFANVQRMTIAAAQEAGEWLGTGKAEIGLKYTGISEGSGIGGDIARQEKELMLLETTGAANLYLSGNILDTFDGMQWSRTAKSSENARFLDYVETQYAVFRFDEANKKDYIRSQEIQVSYTNFKTQYLFVPMKASSLIPGVSGFPYTEEGGQPHFTKKMGYGTSYKVQFQQMNRRQGCFGDMMIQENGYRYGQESQANREILAEINRKLTGSGGKARVTEEQLAEHAMEMQRLYSQPYPISEGVAGFVQRVTGDYQSNYEKLQALERALREFSYTQTPGEIPPGAEFLDYFLLEGQEGYCTYFATAFILMARYMELPARYVQGFYVTGSRQKEITVTSGMAHAWAEVYFEGVGWIPFDPTPTYGGFSDSGWALASQSPAQSQTAESRPVEPVTGSAEELEIVPEGGAAGSNAWLVIPALFLVFLVIGMLVVVTVDRLLSKRRYERLSLPEKVTAKVKDNLRILALMGFNPEPGETLSELKGRLRTEEQLGEIAFSFIDIYEGMYYGNRPAEAGKLVEIHGEKGQLLAVLKQKHSWKYLYIRIQML